MLKVTLLAASVVAAMALTPRARAASAADERTAALAGKVSDTLLQTERWAVASGFPRPFVIAELAKAVLVVIDAAQAPGAEEAAVLDKVAATPNLSTQAQAALEIVRRQTAND